MAVYGISTLTEKQTISELSKCIYANGKLAVWSDSPLLWSAICRGIKLGLVVEKFHGPATYGAMSYSLTEKGKHAITVAVSQRIMQSNLETMTVEENESFQNEIN